MKKINILYILVLIASLVLPTTVFAGQEKVSVCHIDSAYDFGGGAQPVGHVITIADPAYNAHVSHGDPASHIETTLPDGSTVCVSDSDSDGDGLPDYQDFCYSHNVLHISFSLNGPLGQNNNTEVFPFSRDCTGVSKDTTNIDVSVTFAAPDSATALAMCQAYAGEYGYYEFNFFNWSVAYNNAPADWWHCEGTIDYPV